MVGPLSSDEIEDVVSSVRRLVSNELHSRTLSRDLNADRLILTAALRVVPETSPVAPLVLDAPVNEVAPDEDAEIVDAAAAQDRAAADLADAGPGALATDGPPDAEPAALTDDATATAWEDALALNEGEVLAGPAVTEPWIDSQPTEGQSTEAQYTEDQSDAPMADDWEQGEPAWSPADDPVPFVPLRRRAEQLSARLASGEVPAASLADTSEVAPPAEVPADVGADVGAGRGATEFVDADGMPLAVLDEAALHEIVRQTLRIELQGELGERITRNIRKLVRAEINRALLARDLD